MKKLIFSLLTGLLPFLFFISNADAHCEIPCGIYDDQLRTKLIAEHATTIEKSMKQIMELSKANPINYNQLVRWISNKEAHATKTRADNKKGGKGHVAQKHPGAPDAAKT